MPIAAQQQLPQRNYKFRSDASAAREENTSGADTPPGRLRLNYTTPEGGAGVVVVRQMAVRACTYGERYCLQWPGAHQSRELTG